jgi:hypothetical protein
MEHMTLQPSRKARRFWAAFIGLTVVLAAGTVVGVRLSRPARRAHDLLAESTTLQIGRSGLSDVEAVAGRFGITPGNDCTPEDCQLVVTIDNSPLPSWWRRSGATFGTSFVVEKGVLVEREYAMAIGVGPNRPFAEVREREHWRERPEPVDVQVSSDEADPKWRAIVHLTTAASPEVRNRYLSFNLKCLSKFGGCKDAHQLLPTVEWKE